MQAIKDGFLKARICCRGINITTLNSKQVAQGRIKQPAARRYWPQSAAPLRKISGAPLAMAPVNTANVLAKPQRQKG